MRVLALETSGRLGSIAGLEASESDICVVAEQALPEGERTARSLLPAVQSMFAEVGWRPGELELVAVTTGPGSFTGLRIGVVAAKSIAYATGARLVGVHTLAAIAAGVADAGRRVVAVLDAQRQELFVAAFAPGMALAEDTAPATAVLSVEEWLASLQPGDVVAGPPLAKLRDRLPAGVEVADAARWSPSAATVGRLGVEHLRRGHTIGALELVPHYFRKSAAEEKAE